MKRKMAMVLMTLVMAVSLVFGMTTIAQAATEIAWPETFTSSAWSGATELRLPTNYGDFNGGDLNPTAENLGKVRITRGETVYKASNVYGWENKLTFYFNGSGYNGQAAQRGDILTVDAGFAVSKNGNEYNCTNGKNYIFTGTAWVDGTELPQEAEAFVLGDVSSTKGAQIEIKSTQLLTGGDEAELTVNAATNISMTAADGEVYTPSHIRQIVSRKTFKLYFLNANGNGKKYSFDSAKKGDLLTIKKGFAIKGNYNLEAKEDINYIYTGAAWIQGAELPVEKGEMTVTKFGMTSSHGKTDALLYINTDAENTTDFGDADKSYPRGFVTFTFADGTVGDVWYARICKDEVRLFVRNKNGQGNLNVAGLARGDKFVIKTGFAISSDGATEVKADLNYIYTGSEWISGTELPKEAEIAFPATISVSAWNSNTEVRIPTDFAKKNAQNLNPAAETLALVKITRGDTEYKASHVYEWNGCLTFYFNQSGYTGKTAQRGDLLTVGAGFTVNHNGTTYVCKDGVKYIFNGLFWTKGDSLSEQTELELPETLDGSEWNAGGNEVRISSNIENKDVGSLNPVADALALIKVVRGETEFKASHVYGWSASDGKGRLTFYFNGTGYNGKNPEKGDKLVIGKNFMITSGGVEYVCTDGKAYIFNGDIWVDEADYVDYSKFTKTGIVADKTEITLYKGDKFVVPALHYTYKEEVKVPELVEEEVTVENAPDMNTVNEDGYDVTLKAGGFSLTLKVKVLATTDISVSNVIADLAWNRIQVITTSGNEANNTASQKEYLGYFSYMRNGEELTIDNYITLTKNYALDVMVDGNHLISGGVSGIKVGDTLTIKKGLPGINGERLAETVTYVYNGSQFVVLVEPETFSLAETSVTVFINVTKKIVVKDDDKVTAIYSYVSDHPEIATVSPYGVITGVKEGTAKITVSYKNLAKELTVTVKPEPAKTGIEIVTDITKFYVPVSTTEAPTSFVKAGYTLKARYVYEGGEYGEEFDVTEDQIGEIDYTTAGNYDLTVTVGEFKSAVNVEVYNYREVTSFNTLGVSGYDINDDRNTSGTWNGHMIISMSSVSTSAGNLLSTASCETMSEYIVYTTADGKTYYGKGDKDNGIDDRIGLWQLGTNLLIMIKPEGATANLGYGSEDHWKKDAQHPYVPVYKLGDKITFKKGMPIYAWKGALDGSNKPLEGAGCLIVEGIVTEDIVYFCYEDNGTSSLWMIYKEYTGFTVTAEKTMSLGTASPAGAVKVPADATTGTFTYVSDHPEIVSVTKDGNMLAEKVGTATITITLTGGKDADGNDLAPIVKTIKVTVKNGIKSISGKITVQKDAQVNLGDYEITVKYSDGSEVKVKLDDERVVVEDIDASTVGTTTANILFNDGTEQKRGTITVEVVEKTQPADSGNSGKKGCGGSLGGLGILGGLAVAAAVVINKKKRDN